jgi:hypothetical protein
LDRAAVVAGLDPGEAVAGAALAEVAVAVAGPAPAEGSDRRRQAS